MNANELADKAESVQTWEYGTTDDWIEQAATMLRQQQAEIEELKFGKEAAKAWSEISFKKELTDEEIADLIANKVTDSEMIKQALRKAQEK